MNLEPPDNPEELKWRESLGMFGTYSLADIVITDFEDVETNQNGKRSAPIDVTTPIDDKTQTQIGSDDRESDKPAAALTADYSNTNSQTLVTRRSKRLKIVNSFPEESSQNTNDKSSTPDSSSQESYFTVQETQPEVLAEKHKSPEQTPSITSTTSELTSDTTIVTESLVRPTYSSTPSAYSTPKPVERIRKSLVNARQNKFLRLMKVTEVIEYRSLERELAVEWADSTKDKSTRMFRLYTASRLTPSLDAASDAASDVASDDTHSKKGG